MWVLRMGPEGSDALLLFKSNVMLVLAYWVFSLYARMDCSKAIALGICGFHLQLFELCCSLLLSTVLFFHIMNLSSLLFALVVGFSLFVCLCLTVAVDASTTKNVYICLCRIRNKCISREGIGRLESLWVKVLI